MHHLTFVTMPRVVLNVAEKPSVARAITEALSDGQAQWHRSRDGSVAVFPYNIPDMGAVEMHVTAVRGHVFEHDFDQRYRLACGHKLARIFVFWIVCSMPE